jgi:hypothetical protein
LSIKSYVKLQPTELSKHFNIGDNYNLIDGNKLVATKCNTSYRVFIIKNTSKTEWMFNKILEWFGYENNWN